MERVGGMVLCGGQSRRMGHSKAWLPLGSETMLARITRILQEAADPIVVVGAPDQELPALSPEIRVVRDRRHGRGPLEAMAAGFAALRPHVDVVFVSACDIPLLRSAFVKRLLHLRHDSICCVPDIDGRLHPLAAAYGMAIEESIQRLLRENRLSPTLLFELASTRIVQAHEILDIDPHFECVKNVNTPEDYALTLQVAGIMSQ
jgi:molybdopterin-guanine dinucleotide biosynthesis protein A